MTIFTDNIEVGRFYTLERPWLDNKRSVSCIPKGEYEVEPNDTLAHPNTYRVLNVPNRDGILIHIGNLVSHSEGCILVGKSRADVDKDGKVDIARSTEAIREMNKLIGKNNFKLIVF